MSNLQELKASLVNKKALISENALKVLSARYLLKDDTGRIVETPEDLFFRVAANVAEAERVYGGN